MIQTDEPEALLRYRAAALRTATIAPRQMTLHPCDVFRGMKTPFVLDIKTVGTARTVDAPVHAKGAGGVTAMAAKVDAT